MILLSDANILIDLAYVDGLEVLTGIAPTEVLDVVLQECEDERQPGLPAAILAAGVQLIETPHSWVHAAEEFRSAELSLQDRLNLYYAKEANRVLLAADKALRKRAERNQIEVHGTLWIVQEANRRALLPPEVLCDWLTTWPTVGSRLPTPAVTNLKTLLGC